MAKKNKEISMKELTKGYDKLMEGKQVKKTSKELFEKVLKKATKQRGSK